MWELCFFTKGDYVEPTGLTGNSLMSPDEIVNEKTKRGAIAKLGDKTPIFCGILFYLFFPRQTLQNPRSKGCL